MCLSSIQTVCQMGILLASSSVIITGLQEAQTGVCVWGYLCFGYTLLCSERKWRIHLLPVDKLMRGQLSDIWKKWWLSLEYYKAWLWTTFCFFSSTFCPLKQKPQMIKHRHVLEHTDSDTQCWPWPEVLGSTFVMFYLWEVIETVVFKRPFISRGFKDYNFSNLFLPFFILTFISPLLLVSVFSGSAFFIF